MSDLASIKIAVRAMNEMGHSTLAQAYAYQKLGRMANEILGSDRITAWERIKLAWTLLSGGRT